MHAAPCRDILVVTPTSDGNAVDVQYDVTNKKLDAWGQANGVPRVGLCLVTH